MVRMAYSELRAPMNNVSDQGPQKRGCSGVLELPVCRSVFPRCCRYRFARWLIYISGIVGHDRRSAPFSKDAGIKIPRRPLICGIGPGVVFAGDEVLVATAKVASCELCRIGRHVPPAMIAVVVPGA